MSHVTHVNEVSRARDMVKLCITLYIYTYTYKYIYICVFTYICTFISSIWLRRDTKVIYIYIHKCIFTYIYMCISSIWLRRVTHVIESFYAYDWVTATHLAQRSVCKSHIIYECVAVRCSMLQCVAVCCSVLQCVACYSVWRVCNSHITRVNAVCRACDMVMSHIWLRGVTHMAESCHAYDCVIELVCRRAVECVHILTWIVTLVFVHVCCACMNVHTCNSINMYVCQMCFLI